MPAAATTVRDLVVGALVDCGAFGVGMPPPALAVNQGLQRLNWMLSLWNRKRWLCYRIRDLEAAATGAETYAVGPGATFDSIGPRPAKIFYAFLRQLTSGASNAAHVDYPLKIINSHEDYSRIRLKNLASWPYAVFYDPTLQNGTAHFWPVPQSPYTLHIGISEILLTYGSLDEPCALPPEYEATIYYNLMIILGNKYRVPQSAVTIGLARDALNTVKEANNAISELQMPRALVAGGGNYNIYSDNN